MAANLENARKKMMRWRILRILYVGRPYPVGEGLIMEVMDDADLPVTQTELRSALVYLKDKDYVDYKEVRQTGEAAHWEVQLRSKGVDFVEYNIPDDPGITRLQQ
ncbi:MAG: hypothetical protein SV201_04955 [Pseudomonadota bacterium]|nr:hypothetical protein [Pseudomonadota bacterium]